MSHWPVVFLFALFFCLHGDHLHKMCSSAHTQQAISWQWFTDSFCEVDMSTLWVWGHLACLTVVRDSFGFAPPPPPAVLKKTTF